MSWFKNLFKRKPQRLPARDHIGRFLSNDKGEMLYLDSPADEIAKAKAKSLKRDEDRLRFNIEIAIEKKNAERKKTSSAPAKKAPAKSTEKKTAIKSDLADKPVAKKKPAPKKK
jgi:hypothetical protein